MKAYLLVLSFLLSTPVFSKEDKISFETLYRYSVMVEFREKLSLGIAPDIGEHFRLSSSWFLGRKPLRGWRTHAKTEKEAREFCTSHRKNPLCATLDEFIGHHKGVKEDRFREIDLDRLLKFNLPLVSRKDLMTKSFYSHRLKPGKEMTTIYTCEENVELDFALKYLDVLNTHSFDGDGSISEKAMNKYDSLLDDAIEEKRFVSEKDFKEFEKDFEDIVTGVFGMLIGEFENMFLGRCIDEFNKKGFSVYDKKQVYCGGKTPLGCRLFKSMQKRKTASDS